MYKNGDPKKKVAKTDATSVTTSRYYPRLDQPLEPSNNLFNNKEAVAESSGGLSMKKMKKTITPIKGAWMKTKTTIKRPKK